MKVPLILLEPNKEEKIGRFKFMTLIAYCIDKKPLVYSKVQELMTRGMMMLCV